MTLFNTRSPVTLTPDSIGALAEGDLVGCGYVVFLVGKERGEQSSCPAQPRRSEWGARSRSLSFGFTHQCLRSPVRFSAAQRLELATV